MMKVLRELPFPRLSNNSLKLEDLAFKRRKIGELQHPRLEVEGFLTLLFTRSFSLSHTRPFSTSERVLLVCACCIARP